jgi:hypothetical protein
MQSRNAQGEIWCTRGKRERERERERERDGLFNLDLMNNSIIKTK